MATSKFIKFFRDGASASPATGMSVWLVPQSVASPTYPNDYLACTEHATRSGVYYRDNTADGEYKIYIDTTGGTTPVFYDEHIWVGENRITTISDYFDPADSYKLKSEGLKDASITNAKIANIAVTSSKIADDAVTNAKIANDSITEAKIYQYSVTSTKIQNQAVENVKIADDAVTASKIANGAIYNAQIATSADISINKLKIGSDGQIAMTYLDDGDPMNPYSEVRWVSLSGDITVDAHGGVTIKNAVITPSKMANQLKTVTSTAAPTPDYTGQMGKDSGGNIYVAIALTGTVWQQLMTP